MAQTPSYLFVVFSIVVGFGIATFRARLLLRTIPSCEYDQGNKAKITKQKPKQKPKQLELNPKTKSKSKSKSKTETETKTET
jgi:hypothetical protein